MSTIHDIGILLDIQDKNISFEENCVKEGELKGIAVKFVHAKLTYKASHSAHCGIENIDCMIYAPIYFSTRRFKNYSLSRNLMYSLP